MIKKKRSTYQQRAPKADSRLTFTYKRVGELKRFVTEQGMIFSRIKTGLSQKQQRRLSTEVKRARHLAMLPFTQTL